MIEGTLKQTTDLLDCLETLGKTVVEQSNTSKLSLDPSIRSEYTGVERVLHVKKCEEISDDCSKVLFENHEKLKSVLSEMKVDFIEITIAFSVRNERAIAMFAMDYIRQSPVYEETSLVNSLCAKTPMASLTAGGVAANTRNPGAGVPSISAPGVVTPSCQKGQKPAVRAYRSPALLQYLLARLSPPMNITKRAAGTAENAQINALAQVVNRPQNRNFGVLLHDLELYRSTPCRVSSVDLNTPIDIATTEVLDTILTDT